MSERRSSREAVTAGATGAPRAALPARPAQEATTALGVATLSLIALAAAFGERTADAVALEPHALGVAALLWLTISALVLWGLRAYPHRVFGAANAVTTARAAIVVALAALIPVGGEPAGGPLLGPAAADALWLATGAALLALALDGVDGALARASGLASAFGARFDMETDALLALVLAVIVWRTGELGVWVLALGALRYLFLAAGWLWPALRAELPPSRLRKLVCVVQLGALCAIISPLIAPPVSAPLALAALAALVYSFGRDVRRLSRRSARA